jgi:hypothetical protein
MGKRGVHTGFWWGDLREGDHLRDPGVDGRIILKWIFMKWDEGMDWIELLATVRSKFWNIIGSSAAGLQ